MKDNLDLTFKLLGDFRKNLDKRSRLFPSYIALPNILKWHLEVWKKEMSLLGKPADSLNFWSLYFQIMNELESMFTGIENQVLTDNSMDVYSFLDTFQKHIQSSQNVKFLVKEKDERSYIEHILRIFYRTFFEKIGESPNNYNIWSQFPDSWKIRKLNLTKDLIQKLTLGEFFYFVQNRISNTKDGDYDLSLNDISEELFPEVEPIWWAAILIFVFSSYNPNARVKSVIERNWPFGLVGRIRTFSGSINDDENKMELNIRTAESSERANTIKITTELTKWVPIFYQAFGKESAEKYLRETESLDYDIDSAFNRRKEVLKSIFNSVLENYADSG